MKTDRWFKVDAPPPKNTQTHSIFPFHLHQKHIPILYYQQKLRGETWQVDRLNLADRSKLQFLSKSFPEIVLVL